MTEPEARAKAQEARGQYALTSEWEMTNLARRIIELSESFPEQPSRVRDCLAWIARFNNGPAWIELALEDATAQVVRVERSRSQPHRGGN